MMEASVRDTGVEDRIYQILSRDPDRIWNVATLAKETGVSRAKIDRAFVALEVENKITVERVVGNSWIPRLKRKDEGNGKKARVS